MAGNRQQHSRKHTCSAQKQTAPFQSCYFETRDSFLGHIKQRLVRLRNLSLLGIRDLQVKFLTGLTVLSKRQGQRHALFIFNNILGYPSCKQQSYQQLYELRCCLVNGYANMLLLLAYGHTLLATDYCSFVAGCCVIDFFLVVLHECMHVSSCVYTTCEVSLVTRASINSPKSSGG